MRECWLCCCHRSRSRTGCEQEGCRASTRGSDGRPRSGLGCALLSRQATQRAPVEAAPRASRRPHDCSAAAMNGWHTRQGSRFARNHRVVHTPRRLCTTTHAVPSLRAPVADWPRRTASNHGTRFDFSQSARHNAARRQIIQERGHVSQHRKCFHGDVVFGAASAFAQEEAPGPGRVEVTYTPGGAAYVAAKDDAPSFGNYGFGTSATSTSIASSGSKVRSAR